MKNPLLLFCFSLFIFQINLSAQNDYTPMGTITDWYVASSGFLGTDYYWLSYRGDTSIYGKEYRIISNEIAPNILIDVYLREDVAAKKVYRYLDGNDNFEYLYYDYNLGLGDEFEVYYSGSWYTYTVTNMDTIPSEIGPLKYWIFNGPVGSGFSYIETIGGSPLNYESTTFISDPIFATSCAYNGCELYYGGIICTPSPSYASEVDSLNVLLCEGDSFLGHDASGTYTDTLMALNGCDSIIYSNITVQPLLSISESYELCPGEEIYGLNTAGTYIFTLANPNGCDTLLNVNITLLDVTAPPCITTNVKELKEQFEIFPNPALEWLNIDVSTESVKLNIYNLTGKSLINNPKLKLGLNTIQLSSLPSGIYLIELDTHQGKAIEKLIVN